MIVAFNEYVIRMRSDTPCITDKRGFLMDNSVINRFCVIMYPYGWDGGKQARNHH